MQTQYTLHFCKEFVGRVLTAHHNAAQFIKEQQNWQPVLFTGSHRAHVTDVKKARDAVASVTCARCDPHL